MGETAPTGNPSAVPEAPPHTPILPETVTCPSCNTNVPYAAFCNNCGANLPPFFVPPAYGEIPHRRSRALVLGIILVIVLAASIAGVAGYVTYQNRQQSIEQAAHNSELLAANQAITQLTITCFSSRSDTSMLVNATTGLTGYMMFYEKFGVANPSTYSMDARWTLIFNYTPIAVQISSVQSFDLPSKGTAYPEFAFRITGSQVTAFHSATSTVPQFTATLDGTYLVNGTYSTYHISQHQTYDSSTSTGTNAGGHGGNTNTTACP